jgi:mannose-6-phosphate isomerase-like protein (cupin superfamily)
MAEERPLPADGVRTTSREGFERRLAAEGLSSPRWWSNEPGDAYGRHDHPYHKVLYCAVGSIVFHLDDHDVELHEGDRLDVPPGTAHAATVGPRGVTCVEASRRA